MASRSTNLAANILQDQYGIDVHNIVAVPGIEINNGLVHYLHQYFGLTGARNRLCALLGIFYY